MKGERMRDDIWLNVDSKVAFDDIENPQRIAIINPEALRNVSAEKIWERITGSFGKYEYEMWLSEVIVAATMNAAADGSKAADLTSIAGAVLVLMMISRSITGRCLKTTRPLCSCSEILRFSRLSRIQKKNFFWSILYKTNLINPHYRILW